MIYIHGAKSQKFLDNSSFDKALSVIEKITYYKNKQMS